MKNTVLSPTKFKYDYLTNRLWRINPTSLDYLYEIPEERQFTAKFGGNGFLLGDNSWIIFTLYSNWIKVFAKLANTYYRQEFKLIPLNKLPLIIPTKYREIEFELGAENIVSKNEQGQWIPRWETG